MKTPHSAFLIKCTFLTDEQREQLADADLDEPAAVRPYKPEYFIANFAMTPGKAGKLCDAAREAGTTTPAFRVEFPLEVEPDERLERALDRFIAQPDSQKARVLAAAGLTHGVLHADGKVDAPKTLGLHRSLQAGATVPSTWLGQLVVRVDELATPSVLCSPRTGKPLQDGRDEINEVPWGLVGIDALRELAFGFREGMFHGMTDLAVLAAYQSDTDGVRTKLQARMKALKVKGEELDSVVVIRPKPFTALPTPSSHSVLRGGQSSDLAKDLPTFLESAFSSAELKVLLSGMEDGKNVLSNVSERVSLNQWIWECVETLRRRGHLRRNSTFQQLLLAARPHRVAAINALFSNMEHV